MIHVAIKTYLRPSLQDHHFKLETLTSQLESQLLTDRASLKGDLLCNVYVFNLYYELEIKNMLISEVVVSSFRNKSGSTTVIVKTVCSVFFFLKLPL